jgi:hypothetical protein
MQYLHSKLASTGAIQEESSISTINVLINLPLRDMLLVLPQSSQVLQMVSHHM